MRARCFGAQLALHERLVDHHLRGDISEFASLPCLDLFALWFEVPLRSLDSNGDAVDQRRRCRMFGEHRGKHARDNVSKFEPQSVSTSQNPTYPPGPRGSTSGIAPRLGSISGLLVIPPQSAAPRMELLTSTIRLVAPDTFDIRSGTHKEDGPQS